MRRFRVNVLRRKTIFIGCFLVMVMGLTLSAGFGL